MQVRAARGACCERFGVSREDLASDPPLKSFKAGGNPGQKPTTAVKEGAFVRCSSPVHLAIGTRAETGNGKEGAEQIGSEAGEWDTLQHIVRPVQVCTGLHSSAVREGINEFLLALICRTKGK